MADVSSLNPDTTLADLGLDSLMGVEVKQTLERDHDLVLAMREIRQLTVNKLRNIAGGGASSSGTPASDPKAPVKEGGETRPGEVQRATSEERALSFDIQRVLPTEGVVKMNEGAEDSPVFVIHPIEGKLSVLTVLTRHSVGLG